VLVEWALACGEGLARPRYLDLGTGSGAIALALKSQLSEAEVLAVDNSAEALSLAAQNAQHLALNVSFLQSNWFSQVQGKFNVLVSNPPYIEDHDPHLAQLTHEPLQALTSGADGLQDIRNIVQNAPNHLEMGGWLLIEHGWRQAAAVRGLLEKAGFKQVQSKLDLAGIERCSGGKK
jgi:release factor glutamine methyltransferase